MTYFCLYASSVDFNGQFVPIFVFSTEHEETAMYIVEAFSIVSKKHGFSGNFLIRQLKSDKQAKKFEKLAAKHLRKLPEGYNKLVEHIKTSLNNLADDPDFDTGCDYEDAPDEGELTYCIFVEKPDKTDYFPIVVLTAEDADLAQECFEDFVELASEEGLDIRLLLAPVPADHAEMLEEAAAHNLEAVPRLQQLCELFLDIQGESDDLPTDFDPEWN